jgi:hypothetical protein
VYAVQATAQAGGRGLSLANLPIGGAAMSAKKNGKKEPKSDPAVSYDQFKEYEGQKYTGMKVGRSHKWYYDQGEWKETKVTPDL